MDSEWVPGGKARPTVKKEGRATRGGARRQAQYADLSTEEEEEEEEEPPAKPAILDPVFCHSGKQYKQLYVEHLARRPLLDQSNPFSCLLAAAQQEEAQEFQPPLELGAASERFPYAWKWSSDGERSRRVRGQEEEQEPGAPTKVRLCYTCVRSSRLGPLISCDFCPCAFHMDCLDPPLAELPRDVWMCPNHVEPFLDQRLLSSGSATERVHLWDSWARQPLDAHAVKLQFMRRAHRVRNPHFGRNVKVVGRRRARVPGGVKALYKQPSERVKRMTEAPVKSCCPEGGGQGDQELEWVTGLVSLQSQLARERLHQPQTVQVKTEQEDRKPPSPLSSTNPALAALLSTYLQEHATSPLASLDPTVIQYLAHRQLELLLPPTSSPVHEVRARAALTSLSSRRAPTLMRYRSLAIGTGETEGVDLKQYGTCRHFSRKHAVIFYDELSGRYELLNYSAQGSIVDGVQYCLDLEGVGARYPEPRLASPVVTMAGRPGGETACPCPASPPTAGCEGSALLRHGSLLQFGCVQFVFSLSEEEQGRCAEL